MIEEEQPRFTRSDLERMAKDWLERIRECEKREEKWRKTAERAEAVYMVDDEATVEGGLPHFNILHSNIETIVPAIYNSTPQPDIRPRHNNPDGAAKEVADVYERAISTEIDDDRLTIEIEGLAQQSLLAGRGVLRLRYDADDELTNERLVYEAVNWDDFRLGPAQRWRDVPWVAFRHCVTKHEMARLGDEKLLRELEIDEGQDNSALESEDVELWEIWDKESRTVTFLVQDNEKIIAVKDDPLGLRDFFPMPAPVQPIGKTGCMTPVCPYEVYKNLAAELDRITKRINAIMGGLKVRGIILANAEGIERLSHAGDNEIIPVADLENLVAVGGLDRAIAWWPVEQAVNVLVQLYQQRELTLQTIYEVTGISDIVRGASDNRETATAQQIKTQWGSLRIKRLQNMIARTVRDVFILSAEIMSRHFEPQTLLRKAGLQQLQQPEAMQLLLAPLDHYRIDVESDSTVRADLTQKRQEMSEFLNGTAQFFSTMQGLVSEYPQVAAPAAEIYAAFARQFSLGKQAEDAVDQLSQLAQQAGEQQQPDPEQQKMQIEAQAKAQEMQLRQQELALEAQKMQADAQMKAKELELKAAELGLKTEQAEFDAIRAAGEFELEATQERPVEI